jgi:hypothetical protein
MVHFDEHANLAARKTSEEPDLPERMGAINQLAEREFSGSEEDGSIPRWTEPRGIYMSINREQGIVDPQRRPAQWRRRLDHSAQRRRALETTIEPGLDHPKIQSACVVK